MFEEFMLIGKLFITFTCGLISTIRRYRRY